MAYIENVEPSSVDSHQSSPAYVLTFLRWSNRSTANYASEGDDPLDTRRPLIVVNDAIEVTTRNSKQQLSPSCQITLLAGDINYAAAVHPGDFVLVNIVNWESKAMEIRDRASNLQPINRYEDGFIT